MKRRNPLEKGGAGLSARSSLSDNKGGLSNRSKKVLKAKRSLHERPDTPRNELDRVFSQYRRLLFADREGNIVCCTCGAIHPMSEMDAGHFVPRGNDRVRWVEANVWPQCRPCNRDLDGNLEAYRIFLNNVLGGTGAEKVRAMAKEAPIPTGGRVLELLDGYEALLKTLKKDRENERYIPPSYIPAPDVRQPGKSAADPLLPHSV